MRIKLGLAIATLATSLTLWPTAALAFNLLGGRWSASDIGNLTYAISGAESWEVQAWRDGAAAWNSAGTPARLVERGYYDSWKVGLSTWYDANDSRDGYAQLIPSTTANPYTGAFSYINSFYTDGYVPEKRQSVTAHELGHVLGLGHADGAVLMNPFTNVRWDQDRINQPTADDRAGVNALYQ